MSTQNVQAPKKFGWEVQIKKINSQKKFVFDKRSSFLHKNFIFDVCLWLFLWYNNIFEAQQVIKLGFCISASVCSMSLFNKFMHWRLLGLTVYTLQYFEYFLSTRMYFNVVFFFIQKCTIKTEYLFINAFLNAFIRFILNRARKFKRHKTSENGNNW